CGPATFQQNSSQATPSPAASRRRLRSLVRQRGAAATSGLASVMSEQLADTEREQQLASDLRLAPSCRLWHQSRFKGGNESRLAKDEHESEFASPAGQGGESDSDFVLALMLQQEFDREFDRQVRLSEAKLNGNQKCAVTLSNHLAPRTRRARPASDSEEDRRPPPWSRRCCRPGQRAALTRAASRPRRGADLLTKHDAEICGRRNAERMAGFGHAGFRTGDTRRPAAGQPRLYNSLKVHAAQEERRPDSQQQLSQQEQLEQQRRQQLDERTAPAAAAPCDNRRLAEVGEVLKVGDQSLVAALLRGSGSSDVCGVSAGGAACSPRGSHAPLPARAARPSPTSPAGVASPAPLMLRRHLLLTELVGPTAVAAPSLADCLEGGLLSEADWMKAWELTVTALRSTLRLARLVHGNLGRPPPAVVARLRVADRPVPLDGPRPPPRRRAPSARLPRRLRLLRAARPGLPACWRRPTWRSCWARGEAAGDAAAATAEAAAADEESGEEDEDDDDDAEESGDEAGDLLH
uniref:Protein kinase domain-containing protein n=1 Tax=Macrostomum lignano TaxID=282301 RepID=A0A1I8FDG9_9PLAT